MSDEAPAPRKGKLIDCPELQAMAVCDETLAGMPLEARIRVLHWLNAKNGGWSLAALTRTTIPENAQ